MATPGALLRAAKAMPGAARYTPAPQGGNRSSGNSLGQYSPLSAQLLNDNSYASAYPTSFLPRPSWTFTEGAFGPISPILPTAVDQPPEGAERPEARRWEYEPGWNLPSPPGSEGLKLAPFSTLRTIADLYSVARTCIQLRKAEIRGLDWDIIPSHEAAKAYHGDRDAMKDFAERRAKLVKFFRHPDPDYFSFGTWMDALLEEIFVYDALSILIRPKWGRGMGKGLLGSDLDSLALISGPTIRPLVDLWGSVPRPPAPAYQQFLFGVPRSDYMTLITQRDMEEGGLDNQALETYRGDQLLYIPMVPRRWTPYGFPPVERALIPIMSGLQKQAYQMAYFREGTVPEVYISPGDVNMTPNQLRELQDALNAFAGDPAWKHKIIVLPPGSKTEPMKTKEIADQFDEIVMTQVTMAFDVNPLEIGLLPKVSTVASPFAAREMSQASRSIHERTSTKPMLKFLADLFDNIMHRVVGQDDMKFTFEGLQEEDEANQLTQLLAQQVQFGIRSVDEARDELELEPWGLPETSGPVFFGPSGPIPFGQIAEGGMPGGIPPPAGTTVGATEGGPSSSETFNNVPPTTGAANNTGQANDLGPELTPAHMSAQAFMNQPSARPGGGTPSDNAKMFNGSDLTKAQIAEIEALTRQIQKGRDPGTWKVKNIPAYVPSLVYNELEKGTGTTSVRELISQVILGDTYDWHWNGNSQSLNKLADPSPPKDWPGWKYDLQLAKVYTKKLRGAFERAVHQASLLIRKWWSGDLATTRQGLIHMITDIMETTVGGVLNNLWTEAWFLGDKSGEAVEQNQDPDFGSWFPGDAEAAKYTQTAGDLHNLLDAYGIPVIKSIADSHMDELAQAISEAISKGEGPEDLIKKLPNLLTVHSRASMIARTETARAITAATQARFKNLGVTRKEWETAPDDVCPVCRANKAEGPIPTSSLFQSGAPGPPQHPHCRCILVPAAVEKRRRRRVGLHGQVLPDAEDQTYHSEPGAGFNAGGRTQPPNAGGGWGGGGQQMRPHDATGTQYEDIPGASWGHEPPRWDYGMAGPGGAFGNGDINRVPNEDRWPDSPNSMTTPTGWEVEHYDEDPMEGRNPFYPPEDNRRPNTDFHDQSEPHSRDDEEDVPEDEDDADYPRNRRGRAPNSVGKAKKKYKPWKDKSIPIDERIYRQLKEDYPDDAINWVRHVTWKEPQEIPVSKIDYSNEDAWKASHHVARVEAMRKKFLKRAEQGVKNKPMILVKSPGNSKYVVVDGHHRALAYRKGDLPAWGYVALVSKNKGPWLHTHHMQKPESGDETGSTDVSDKVFKDASNYNDANPVEAEHVINQMRENYPEKSIEWMKDAHWMGPVKIPLDRVDFDSVGKWAAWHQQEHVDHFKKLIQGKVPVHPVVAVQPEGNEKVDIVDGHHRALAFKELRQPVIAYVGTVHGKHGPWEKTHLYQIHQGGDPQNKGKGKKKGKPRAAGIVVQAKDTGRILMLQRHLDD